MRRRERHCRRAEIRAGWPHPGSCPAGDGAIATVAYAVATEKDSNMSHSKTPTKTKFARARSPTKRPAKPGTIPRGSVTRSGTKQEAVLRRWTRSCRV